MFPTSCAETLALLWSTCHWSGTLPSGWQTDLLSSQNQPEKVGQRLIPCCDIFRSASGSPYGIEVCALRGGGWRGEGNGGLMGNHHLGLSQIMRCWATWPFWLLRDWCEQSANHWGPIIGKTRWVKWKRMWSLKKQNTQKNTFLKKNLNILTGAKRKIFSLFTLKSKKKSVFHFKQHFSSRVSGNPFIETCVSYSNSKHCPTLRCMQTQIFGREKGFVK